MAFGHRTGRVQATRSAERKRRKQPRKPGPFRKAASPEAERNPFRSPVPPDHMPRSRARPIPPVRVRQPRGSTRQSAVHLSMWSCPPNSAFRTPNSESGFTPHPAIELTGQRKPKPRGATDHQSPIYHTTPISHLSSNKCKISPNISSQMPN